jgi:hypothetical protein
VDEPRFASAGLRHHSHYLTVTLQRQCERTPQRHHFMLAPDELC